MGQSQCTLDANGAKVSFGNRAFASGEYRRAHKGKYVSGPKRGRPCVVKIYKSRRHENWEGEINIARTAKRVADAFNHLPSRRRRGPVRILVPALGTISGVAGCMAPARMGQRVTVEDFIVGRYEKFVSNNGTFRFPGTLTAFAHFSYDHSGGELIVVDLQGVRTDNGYTLTDPAIHSTVKGDIDSDFGRDGNPYGARQDSADPRSFQDRTRYSMRTNALTIAQVLFPDAHSC